MGLWSDLFRHAAAGPEALLSPGRTYSATAAPPFPALGSTFHVTTGAPLPLDAVVGAGRPSIVLLYSNC